MAVVETSLSKPLTAQRTLLTMTTIMHCKGRLVYYSLIKTLYNNPRTRGLVNAYAFNQAMFFLDFQQAMVKMGLLDVKEGSNGEVRTNCRIIN
ncbi:hypothetical protein RND71_026346 [Anisodus tanguticus]|uniref:peroxidase n=1 Tax=Anisodus tanguticus TaxID=243964 RepID=A0AAE1RNR1_9SOLA|nr:hypothetical protein RND71_026346 [Anisodus tanguticus]